MRSFAPFLVLGAQAVGGVVPGARRGAGGAATQAAAAATQQGPGILDLDPLQQAPEPQKLLAAP